MRERSRVLLTPPATGRLPALRHRDFAVYWIGTFFSGIGMQFTLVAMAWQLYELTDSALQLGLLGLSRGIPTVVLMLFGGLLADAVDRRRLLILTQWLHIGMAAGLTGATLAGAVSPAVLYLAAAMAGAATSLEQPSRQALVPNLVPRSELPNALALNMTQRQVGMIAGPSIGGIVLAFLGPGLCYATELVSRLPMLAALAVMRPTPQLAGGRGAVSMTALWQGTRFLWSQPLILSIMLLDLVQGLFADPRILLPIYARDILHVGPQGLGILYAAISVGSVLTATALSLRGQIEHAGRWVLLGITLFALATIGFAYSEIFWLSVLMLGLEGVGNTLSVVLRGTILQLATPDELRGRVSAVSGVFTMGGPQFGHFRAGLAAEILGPPMAVLSGAVLLLGLTAAVARSAAVREFRIGASPTPAVR